MFSKINATQFDLLPSLIFTHSVKQPSLINQVYRNELALKGMVLEDQQGVLRSISKSGDNTVLQLYKQWRFKKAFLGKQLLLSRNKRLPYLDSLLEVTNQLEQQLSRRTAGIRNMSGSQAITGKILLISCKKARQQ
jgi:hypothetical protein